MKHFPPVTFDSCHECYESSDRSSLIENSYRRPLQRVANCADFAE